MAVCDIEAQQRVWLVRVTLRHKFISSSGGRFYSRNLASFLLGTLQTKLMFLLSSKGSLKSIFAFLVLYYIFRLFKVKVIDIKASIFQSLEDPKFSIREFYDH